MTDIEAAWTSLAGPIATELNGVLMPGVPASRECFLALDSEARRHLLVACDPSYALREPLATRGLAVSVERLAVGAREAKTYLTISCLDKALAGVFLALAEDLRKAIQSESGDAVDSVLRAVQTWRWFWGVSPAGLSEERALGLFGELWFLHRWMGRVGRSAIEGWTGADAKVRDFELGATAIEVKTRGNRTGPVVHKVSSLDQLDCPGGRSLYLFSLHAVEDEHSSNSLEVLVSEVRRSLEGDPVATDTFLEKLAAYGYSPVHAGRYGRGQRVVAERLFRVVDGFPRLTRRSFPDGLPVGVTDVEYTIDTSACGDFLVATSPDASPLLRPPAHLPG